MEGPRRAREEERNRHANLLDRRRRCRRARPPGVAPARAREATSVAKRARAARRAPAATWARAAPGRGRCRRRGWLSLGMHHEGHRALRRLRERTARSGGNGKPTSRRRQRRSRSMACTCTAGDLQVPIKVVPQHAEHRRDHRDGHLSSRVQLVLHAHVRLLQPRNASGSDGRLSHRLHHWFPRNNDLGNVQAGVGMIGSAKQWLRYSIFYGNPKYQFGP